MPLRSLPLFMRGARAVQSGSAGHLTRPVRHLAAVPRLISSDAALGRRESGLGSVGARLGGSGAAGAPSARRAFTQKRKVHCLGALRSQCRASTARPVPGCRWLNKRTWTAGTVVLRCQIILDSPCALMPAGINAHGLPSASGITGLGVACARLATVHEGTRRRQ